MVSVSCNKQFLLLLVAIVLTMPLVSSHTISGNTAYINTSQAYIGAYPHTIVGSDYVTIEYMTKVSDIDVNVIFGYNRSYLTPRVFDYWNPHNDTINKSYKCLTSFNYTLNPNHFVCYVNATTLFEHDFTTGNITAKTAYWTENVSSNWTTSSGNFNQKNLTFDGKDKWFYKTNIHLVNNTLYRARIWIDAPYLPVGKTVAQVYPGYDGKYDIAFYPSSYGTNISGAINDGKFYYLDPIVNLSSGLIAYYYLSSDFKDSTGLYNGTGGAGAVIGTPGIPPALSNGSVGNAANNYLSIPAIPISKFNSTFTIIMWVNISNSVDLDNLFSEEAGTYPYLGFGQLSGSCGPAATDLCIENGDGSGAAYKSFVGYYNKSTMIAIVSYGNKSVDMYFNDTVQAHADPTNQMSFGSFSKFYISGQTNLPATRYIKGRYASVMIWNRALNQTDVTAAYNNGTGCAYPTDACGALGAETPYATFLTVGPPANNSFTANTSPEFSFNLRYAGVGYNVTLYINGSTYGMNNTFVNNTLATMVVNHSLVAPNEYAWYWNVTNGSTSNVSDTYWLYVTGAVSGTCSLANINVSSGCSIVSVGGCPFVQ